jgi:hypothetical protein
MFIWILFAIIVIVVLAGGAYFAYTKYGKKDSAASGNLGPTSGNLGPGPVGDTITIGTDGVTRSGGSTTETYIDMPLTSYCSQPSRPAWCNLTPTSEMQYVYDPVGGSTTDAGAFKTTFDNNTGLCSDGTRDCIYTEVYDSARILTKIVNEKGERMIEKFVDDLWSGKLQFSDTTIDLFKKIVRFENGKLYMVMDEDGTSKLQIVPGSNMEAAAADGKITVTPGMIILWVSLYYKFNNKTKPFIELNLKSEKPVGEVLLTRPVDEI